MYRLDPRYSPVPQAVLSVGWEAVAEELPQSPAVVAVDGPPSVDWEMLVDRLTRQATTRGTTVLRLDVRSHYAPPGTVRQRTVRPEDEDDPYYCRLARNPLDDLFTAVPRAERPTEGLLLVYGPGAALVTHDLLWYADVPKRHAEAQVGAGTGSNLGLPTEKPDHRRLFYVDWPMLDRHRDALAPRLDGWLDVQEPERPALLDGAGLRATLAELARRPVRTRPFFNSTPWGGHWAQRELGFNPEARNTALGYELIAPEAGVLIGEGPAAQVEVPFPLLCVLHPEEVLGREVHQRFGTSFPIRFDYLDTVGGGNLSVHCHPTEGYMRERFGWEYTQEETYYMTQGGPDTKVYLGLREDASVERFRAEVEAAVAEGVAMDPEDHVLSFPGETGQLFMIPPGTVHASGAGNLVLEISATPYLYSLRFYDWLRPAHDGQPRPLPVEHAFANLDTERRGRRVAEELVQRPRTLREGEGWREELLGALAEMFYEVRRFALAGGAVAEDDTAGRFHVLNVVSGTAVRVETAAGHQHEVAFAETLTLPAAVGGYRLRAVDGPAQVVKALVR